MNKYLVFIEGTVTGWAEVLATNHDGALTAATLLTAEMAPGKKYRALVCPAASCQKLTLVNEKQTTMQLEVTPEV